MSLFLRSLLRSPDAPESNSGGSAPVDASPSESKGAAVPTASPKEPTPTKEGPSPLEARLAALEQEHAANRDLLKHYATIASGNAPLESLVTSTRAVMRSLGHPESEIDAHISDLRAQASRSPSSEGGESGKKGSSKEQGSEEESEVARLRREVEEFRRATTASTNEVFRARIEDSIAESVETSPEIKATLTAYRTVGESVGDREGNAERLQKIRQEMQDEIRSRAAVLLRDKLRASPNQQASLGWVAPAVAQAAKDTAAKFSRFLPSSERLARANKPTLEDRFKGKEPVRLPEYKPGKDQGVLEGELKDWITDTLGRAAVDTTTAGATKA